jgi:DNA-binding response OmpR family regulator
MNQHPIADDNVPCLHLALWEPDHHAREKTACALGGLGFVVQGCQDAAGLFEHLDNRGADLVLVGEGASQPHSLRSVLPRLSARYDGGILVQAPGADAGARLDAMRAGAHLCLDRRYEAAELAALLRAQARRANRTRRAPGLPAVAGPGARPDGAASDHATAAAGVTTQAGLPHVGMTQAGLIHAVVAQPIQDRDLAGRGDGGPAIADPDHGGPARSLVPEPERPADKGALPARTLGQPAPPAPPWRVLYQGWVLITPNGSRVHLTGTERACFACLLADERREMSRAALSARMSAANLRSVNVSISRLRKKVYETGMRLPLHTVHGMGYVFVGELAAQD